MSFNFRLPNCRLCVTMEKKPKGRRYMKKAKFVCYIVLAATTLASALIFVASVVLTCIDMMKAE